MILDGHIHLGDGRRDPAAFMERLEKAGVDGGVVISLPPAAFPSIAASAPVSQRLDDVLYRTFSKLSSLNFCKIRI